MAKQDHCRGCRNDFYNGQNDLGVKKCWSFKGARVVTRYRIGWWTAPTSKKSYRKVRTLDCHHATGKYMDYKSIPRGTPSTPPVPVPPTPDKAGQ